MIRALILISIVIATPASAQRVCGVAKQVLPAFERQGETKVFEGLASAGYRVVVTSDAKTGKFTIFGVYPNGLACILDAGEAAHVTIPESPGQGT